MIITGLCSTASVQAQIGKRYIAVLNFEIGITESDVKFSLFSEGFVRLIQSENEPFVHESNYTDAVFIFACRNNRYRSDTHAISPSTHPLVVLNTYAIVFSESFHLVPEMNAWLNA